MTDGSFEEFYDATYGRLLRQIVLVTGDPGDAEDLLQDAYGRAAVRWKRLRDYQAPEAWVRRVALRLATDRARRIRRRAAALCGCGHPGRRWNCQRTCWTSTTPCAACRPASVRRWCFTIWWGCRSRRSPASSTCRWGR